MPPSQATLVKALKATHDPGEQCVYALELLAITHSRQSIDLALQTLGRDSVQTLLDDSHRPILRKKALYYLDNPGKDKGGLIREAIIRLLVSIGSPDDLDVYLRGVAVYEAQPVTDVTQNLRAASLAGLAVTDRTLAGAYAVKLLGEPDTSQLNCEPSMTAARVLAGLDIRLPLYQFVLRQGREFIQGAKGEVVGLALESLGADFPLVLYRGLADLVMGWDAAVATAGLINAIVDYRLDSLYDLLDHLIEDTRHDDLYRFGMLALAASRDETLWEQLYTLARQCPQHRKTFAREAVELTSGPERDSLLTTL